VATFDADELYRFILANAEEIGGQTICRASLAVELRRRGVERPWVTRARLVRELEARGLVFRPDPRSRELIILDPPDPADCTPKFGSDVAATKERIARLRGYMCRNVLNGRDFVCSSWRECEDSIQAGCTLSHPSAWGKDRWDSPDSPYVREVVRPTLERAAASL
jgi:transposase InsO family protein